MAFAKVEAGRADEVTDVFDKQNAVIASRQARRGVGNHLRIEMAALAGIDLNRRRAGGADARGIVDRLLIAFNDRAVDDAFQAGQSFGEQGGFTGAGTGDQI